MLDLCLLVIGQNQAECEEFDRASVDCEVQLVTNEDDRPMATVANEYLDKCDRAVFGLIHPDVSFGPGGLQAFFESALAGNVCGIVGRDMRGAYRWCYEHPGPVSTLDDCSVFFRRDSGLWFDEETCNTFYAYVPDLCLQAHARGIPVIVPTAQAKHTGKRFFTEHEVRRIGWDETLARVKAKWAGTEFQTT